MHKKSHNCSRLKLDKTTDKSSYFPFKISPNRLKPLQKSEEPPYCRNKQQETGGKNIFRTSAYIWDILYIIFFHMFTSENKANMMSVYISGKTPLSIY